MSQIELSPREKQVLAMTWDGLSIKEIAQMLDVSLSAVKGTRESLFNKFGVDNSVSACRMGLKRGYLEADRA